MIKFITKDYNASTILEESIVPAIGSAINVQNNAVTTLSDYEGLFLGFGKRETCYPYREINMYTEATPSKVRVAILENDYLYAEFLVDFGGRLWVLKNKKTGEDLLYTNDVIRIRNLSLRNGWFSGGVEWNIGVVGHTAYTCDPLYTAKVIGKNGEEVLRFYEFERVREVYYQIDFWLDADKLMTRVRIENPSMEVVPMYWWSNIASPEYKGGRLVVDAESAFSNCGSNGIGKATIPVVENGTDVSFYEDIPSVIDYFFDIKNRSEKFIANINGNGSGLLQCSSSRQQGRKLFSWGHNSGGKHWQDVLTDNAGYYIEIQAGLGKTQYGCVPMAPNTSYEWVEVYTNISVSEETLTGDYRKLVREVKSQLFSEKIDTETLDEVCDITRDSIALVAGEVIYKGSGFGYVKDCVDHTMPKHLHFELCDKSKKYFDLVTSGKYDSDIVNQTAFAEEKYQIIALKAAVERGTCNWNVYYQLAVYSAYNKDFVRAESLCVKSMSYDNNYLNNHLMAFILNNAEGKNSLYFARKSITLECGNYSLAESVMRLFLDKAEYESVIEIYGILPNRLKDEHRLKMYLAMSHLKLGDATLAESILMDNGGLFIIDYREGELLLDKLYRGIRADKYSEKYDEVIVPMQFDFLGSGE